VEEEVEKNLSKQGRRELKQVVVVVVVTVTRERNLVYQERNKAGKRTGSMRNKMWIKMKRCGALLVDRRVILGDMMIALRRIMTFMASRHREGKEHSDLETGLATAGTGEIGREVKGQTKRALLKVRPTQLNLFILY
jgi:hypothetical protein